MILDPSEVPYWLVGIILLAFLQVYKQPLGFSEIYYHFCIFHAEEAQYQ